MTGSYDFKRWRGDDWWTLPKGCWTTTKTPETSWKDRSIFIACPVCGEVGSLPHAVDVQGRVSPSVVCPNRPKCPMHLMPTRLLDWDLGARAPER